MNAVDAIQQKLKGGMDTNNSFFARPKFNPRPPIRIADAAIQVDLYILRI